MLKVLSLKRARGILGEEVEEEACETEEGGKELDFCVARLWLVQMLRSSRCNASAISWKLSLCSSLRKVQSASEGLRCVPKMDAGTERREYDAFIPWLNCSSAENFSCVI